jgi:hypothetical protein
VFLGTNTIFLNGASGTVGTNILKTLRHYKEAGGKADIQVKGQYFSRTGKEEARIKEACPYVKINN